jgi:hypothetical protein
MVRSHYGLAPPIPEGDTVQRVEPYHSSNPDDPAVYHDHALCPSGRKIPPKWLVPGDGGRPLCEFCRAVEE